ncbi:plastocyanin/azurin family copper-binding protein [Roseibium porphyridii]|uniref:Plastocyanin/azurin family copper-binding protein n=1 Tax=Roseibium porphyridii TaxID=2866279 RepID=A0ABY8FA47_9HYPH|nr:plastocyanin/azurin family copper-binding protein [Roseibium sp. KMA01]WFE89523.1 plastocyanin/azurin family copper-binding protein [Roseibium sp. KMA01]
MFVQACDVPAILVSVMLTLPACAEDAELKALCDEAESRYTELFGHPSSEEEGVTVVTMYKYRFCPQDLTVPVGTTVRWVNVDKRTSHSLILKDEGEPESDRLFPEETFEFTFLTPGDQTYLCGPHWETQEMIGMITVSP